MLIVVRDDLPSTDRAKLFALAVVQLYAPVAVVSAPEQTFANYGAHITTISVSKLLAAVSAAAIEVNT